MAFPGKATDDVLDHILSGDTEVNETHAAYGKFMPGGNSADCSSWNTDSPHGDVHILMPSPPSPPPSPPYLWFTIVWTHIRAR